MDRRNDFQPRCAFCDSTRMSLVMDFGDVALAGAFLKPEQLQAERKYPLRVCFCKECYAVQVADKVPPSVLFENYFYFSSSIGTLREHFRTYAEEISKRFLHPSTSTVLEFGCNDGVLLRPLADQGIRTVIGVDPAKNVVATINDNRVTIVNDFFTESVAKQVVSKYGKVDVIMANNVYAHIPDIQGTTRAVRSALSDDGVFVFEVHYLDKVIKELQFDMIYHEHLYYYSLLSAIKHFERYDMMVFDVAPVPVHAGSMRFYVCKNASRHAAPTRAVTSLIAEEKEKGYDCSETFDRFASDIKSARSSLMELLIKLKASGKQIGGYGASGRANTLLQYCGITDKLLDFIVDDAPAKTGYYTPGSHLPIYPSSVLLTTSAPDYMVLFAWSFADEIVRRNVEYFKGGGQMIIPLPCIKILRKSL